MVAAGYNFVQSAQAREIYSILGDEARFVGLVPDLFQLVIVSDPMNVLSPNELNEITTGLEDQQLRATFDLMPQPLRFVLKVGYPFDFTRSELKDYMMRQKPWRERAEYYAGERLKKRPTMEEASEQFLQDGAAFFHIRELFLNPSKAIKAARLLQVPLYDNEILDFFCGREEKPYNQCVAAA